jgi:hypothetical protein
MLVSITASGLQEELSRLNLELQIAERVGIDRRAPVRGLGFSVRLLKCGSKTDLMRIFNSRRPENWI